MTTVTQKLVTEIETHKYVAEASTLGLRPGEWPEFIETTLGNTQPLFRSTKKLDADGDILYVRYRQVFGCIDVVVYND